MKSIVADWLRSARTDLETIDAIIANANLTTVIAFHSQQCVGKCLKALLEEFQIETRKSHNLLTLKAAVESEHPIDLDEDTLSLLNQLYIDSRYPGELGLLPAGAPTLEDAREFARFANETMEIVVGILAGQIPESAT
jgi:HEPN domain-containing protein